MHATSIEVLRGPRALIDQRLSESRGTCTVDGSVGACFSLHPCGCAVFCAQYDCEFNATDSSGNPAYFDFQYVSVLERKNSLTSVAPLPRC